MKKDEVSGYVVFDGEVRLIEFLKDEDGYMVYVSGVLYDGVQEKSLKKTCKELGVENKLYDSLDDFKKDNFTTIY